MQIVQIRRGVVTSCDELWATSIVPSIVQEIQGLDGCLCSAFLKCYTVLYCAVWDCMSIYMYLRVSSWINHNPVSICQRVFSPCRGFYSIRFRSIQLRLSWQHVLLMSFSESIFSWTEGWTLHGNCEIVIPFLNHRKSQQSRNRARNYLFEKRVACVNPPVI